MKLAHMNAITGALAFLLMVFCAYTHREVLAGINAIIFGANMGMLWINRRGWL